MATLREALDQSPVGKASNANQAWGYASISYAERLPDGRIEVSVYETEGDWREVTYDTPEDASLALFTQQDFAWDVQQKAEVPVTGVWDGADEWQAVMKEP